MKKVAVIGSPSLHKNYQTALEKTSCKAVIFPDSSYIKRHPDLFDGLLLPGGGDVLPSLSDYAPFAPSPSVSSGTSCSPVDFRPVRREVCCPFTDPLPAQPECPRPSAGSSSDIPLDLEQLSALHLFYEQKKPVFGICKGMQLINLYFCGTIREVSNRNLHRRQNGDAFHPADNLPGSFLHALFGPYMLVNSNHHQCIHTSGQDLQIIQRSRDGEAEAVSHLSAPVMGTQWHPERMPNIRHQDAILLFRYFVSLL